MKTVWTAEMDEDCKSLTLQKMKEKYGLLYCRTMKRREELGVSFPKGPRPGPNYRGPAGNGPRIRKVKPDTLTEPLIALLLESNGLYGPVAAKLGVCRQAVFLRVRGARNRVRNTRPADWPDLTGARFGLLTVVLDTGRTEEGEAVWLCKCVKHKAALVRTSQLLTGAVKSCGCADEPARPLPEIECKKCGALFSPPRSNRKYCSQVCVREVHREIMRRQFARKRLAKGAADGGTEQV